MVIAPPAWCGAIAPGPVAWVPGQPQVYVKGPRESEGCVKRRDVVRGSAN